jgi:GntR family transcriptional regulator, transcriptional repressor for pyruvate dehydrogenase complex
VFEPLEKRQSLGAEVAQHLQEMLLNGTFRPGDYLPSQRDLAQQFGTSLAAVREAISILSAAGLIDARPGRGTVVLSVSAALPTGFNVWLGAIHNESEAKSFLETRQILEHYTLMQATQKATPEQIQRLQEILLEMKNSGNDPELFVQADLALHFFIADTAGNPVVARLLRVIHTPLAHLLRALSVQMIEEGRFERIYATHRDMVNAIARGSGEAAADAFDRMLQEALLGDALKKALGQGEITLEPLGKDFLEDLRWNLTRLIGPMSEVILSDAAGELGVVLERLTKGQLRAYLNKIALQLPLGKQEEWLALTELFYKRYEA